MRPHLFTWKLGAYYCDSLRNSVSVVMVTHLMVLYLSFCLKQFEPHSLPKVFHVLQVNVKRMPGIYSVLYYVIRKFCLYSLNYNLLDFLSLNCKLLTLCPYWPTLWLSNWLLSNSLNYSVLQFGWAGSHSSI